MKTINMNKRYMKPSTVMTHISSYALLYSISGNLPDLGDGGQATVDVIPQ